MSENQENPVAQEEQPKILPTPAPEPVIEKPVKKSKPFNWLLWVSVILPTVCSITYFGFIAADQYVSESSFIVRSANNRSGGSGLEALFQNVGMSRSQDDSYAVQEYMRSRTALNELSKTMKVRDFYEQKGDAFSRFNGFGWENSEEAFYQYYRGKLGINLDSVSGITTLRVQSFGADESQNINAALLKKGETLINSINERARKDTVKFAEQAVETAQEKVQEASSELMKFRTTNGVLDLKEQSGMQLSLVSKLQDELIAIQTQLDQVRAVTPDNPQISGLETREKSLLKEIARQTKMMTGATGKSIANKAAEYQHLVLNNELAEKQLTIAISSLETAKSEADRQQLYLEVVSHPSKPDMPQLPNRLYNIVATFIIGLMVYGILSLLSASVREHKN
ncbi:capsule biosynthesis protein [Kingella negevensis]|uniref:capsule biosynthesis protein n=1 Tax=Kingella negevensis TaxID=1522312 RepID=UPI0009E021E8|nr:capsule biosynthesis protein [Kingella negevensis]MDK4688452.1 capsule biosynthesis protein [Kingella negevensis]WII90292.1 capsule biosynthesis protein [Kingella negevensis]